MYMTSTSLVSDDVGEDLTGVDFAAQSTLSQSVPQRTRRASRSIEYSRGLSALCSTVTGSLIANRFPGYDCKKHSSPTTMTRLLGTKGTL